MSIEQVVLSIPDAVVTTGVLAKIPVNISDLTGLNVCAYELIVECDPAEVSIDGYDSTGTLTAGWMSAFNNYVSPFSKSKIKLAVASATPTTGAGTLVYLNCTPLVDGNVTLTPTSLVLNETTVPLAPVPLTTPPIEGIPTPPPPPTVAEPVPVPEPPVVENTPIPDQVSAIKSDIQDLKDDIAILKYDILNKLESIDTKLASTK